MPATLIDGKAAAAALREQVAEEARAFQAAAGRHAGLAVVLVGDDPASAVYVGSKEKATRTAGMAGQVHRLSADIDQPTLMALIDRLNADPAVDGILVQLPLPAGLDSDAVIAAVDPAKDVDGFHPLNVGRLASGLPALVPCTPKGCIFLLRQQLGSLSGLDAVVIGRSAIVGRPMAQLLLTESCTVTIAHSRTRDLPAIVSRADIVVAAVGRPEMVRGDWLKPGATVIDVGINRVEGRLVGDVAFDEAMTVAGAVTPVPGGVGPMTIAVLLANTVEAARRREGLA
ncbi:methylenetetrahydrofolate dehydrogenase (NADP+)/methenyltetrahydrofolate cyclohydrolase [Sphingomonas jejuensis]|uniref:Bifunctional protein FolD n=1 Tax=Sphingomonas jejuensis TaxID=904715 RepID=A0ABX0XNN3_9SPHN|nr:methylenetetrahydrofolate dehydrogenase (NADP+)/methenyltetrahydrofolate cyclohydrolase [Sphingomonas jejuensis]